MICRWFLKKEEKKLKGCFRWIKKGRPSPNEITDNKWSTGLFFQILWKDQMVQKPLTIFMKYSWRIFVHSFRASCFASKCCIKNTIYSKILNSISSIVFIQAVFFYNFYSFASFLSPSKLNFRKVFVDSFILRQIKRQEMKCASKNATQKK